MLNSVTEKQDKEAFLILYNSNSMMYIKMYEVIYPYEHSLMDKTLPMVALNDDFFDPLPLQLLN